MAISIGLMSVKVKLEGFTCSDGTPLEPLVKKWAGEGENAWPWRRTDDGFEIDVPVRTVPTGG